MSNHKLKPVKYETCYRLIPTIMFIIAVTAVVLTMFFMFVLQTGNAYADGDLLDDILIGNEDLKYDVIHGKLNGKADDNSKVTHTTFVDNESFPSTPMSPISTDSPFATFMLKKSINPTTTNNHIKSNNLRNLKAYKIISKEPIMENSLVKIVMAPQNVLEKLSKQHGNVKYAGDKIDEIANGPIKYDDNDVGPSDRELISMENGMDDVDISREEDRNFGLKKPIHSDIIHQASNNIQVIAKIDKKRSKNVNSVVRKMEQEIATHAPATEVEMIHDEKQVKLFDVGMKPFERETELTTEAASPSITTYDNIEDVYIDDDALILNEPTQSSALENIDLEMESSNVRGNSSTESKATDVSEYETSLEHMEKLDTNTSHQEAPQEDVTNDVVKTVLPDQTTSQATLDSSSPSHVTISPLSSPPVVANPLEQLSNIVPKAIATRKITRPTTTTMVPLLPTKKEKKFPKKVNSDESYSKYKKLPKSDDDSSNNFTPKVSLFEMELTNPPPQSEATGKSKNIKRAIGDEGTFSSIVRPSPNRPNGLSDLFPAENSAERADRLHKSMTRLMHFVTVVGQVDSYLTKRFRSGLKNVVRMLGSDEETRRRRSH